MLVFSGSSNKLLASKVARQLNTRLGKVELSRFSNDEARVWIREKRVSDRVVLLQSLSQPTDHNLVEFCLMVDALKRMGVHEVVAVIPWLGYSKQDKVFRRGEPLSIEVMAEILQTAVVKKIITFDLHSEKIKDYFKVPVINLKARSVLVDYFRKRKNLVVVAPDRGAVSECRKVVKDLGVDLVVIEKRRDLESGNIEIVKMQGNVRGKHALIFDDMIASGSTLLETAELLSKKGAKSIEVAVTHHLYVNKAQEKIDKSVIDKLVVTDTVALREKSKKLKILSVADLIAKEIRG